MAKEEWKTIEDLEGFEISNKGNIRSWLAKGPHRLTDQPHSICVSDTPRSPYLYFRFTGGRKSVHREVAKAFIPNPHNLPQVNHKDENVLNNNVENLEWCSCEYNNIYSFGKPVTVINPEGVIIDFDSIGSLSRAIGANVGNISRFIRGIRYKNGYKGWKRYG